MIIKILKILRFAVLTFLGSIALYLIFSIIISIIPFNGNKEKEKVVVIFVRTNGVHTDLVLPIRYDSVDWSKKVKFSNTIGNDSVMNFVAFGWGDKGFYLNTPNWSDLKFSTAFTAAFGFGEPAMHVTYYKDVFETKNSIRIEINKRQYFELVKYIQKSFNKTEKGEFINIKTIMVYDRNDAFYEGTGSFSLFNTCNTWTNKGLKICEQRACLWTPFDKGIFYHYNNKINGY
ncbi:MAG TPA: TIGR02117 family protein [Prolixibacteraceae bacterium]|nr:TIGR02117 family protein [Prolixibacteraceae bacterium]